MGFFDKIKNALGIGGVKVKLQVPAQVGKDSGTINGKLSFTSKSDKKVKGYSVYLQESYKTGRGDNQQTKEFELGKVTINQGFDMKTGEIKELDFALPFSLIKSANDRLKDQGGVIGGLGKVSGFLDGEKSTYKVHASVSVEGTLLDPSDYKEIKITAN
jgi:hypothetical protein